jgi:hypothetical protein
MTTALIILACVIVAGYGFSLYNTKILAPAFETERKEIMKLVREALPGVKIHELNPRLHTWLTYLGTEYFISVPNYKSGEDGGPNTSVSKVCHDRRITSIWQKFHADSKVVNAQYFSEALKVIKAETPNQIITDNSGASPLRV